MPIHLPPLTRREMLARTLSATAGVGALSLTGTSLHAQDESREHDPSNWLLWSDTHIDANRDRDKKEGSEFYMYNNFVMASKEALAKKKRAAGIFINGDCANLYGTRKDYEVLAELLEPLSEAGYPVHMTMGNHDSRSMFWKVLKGQRELNPGIKGRRIGVVHGKDANWFLLDSLKVINGSPGELGDKQIAWLEAELDKHSEKPAILMMHHNPKNGISEKADRIGLIDTDKLLAAIRSRKNVKAVIFGHTHHWGIYETEGIHLINLPALGRIFRPEEPLGWVDATLRPNGMELELRSLDKKHKAHGKIHDLKWRA